MKIIPVADLKAYDQNPRNITHEAYERLKEQLLLGQHTTLLVMPDGTVLSGNMRLRAMKDLGIDKAKCIEIDFIQEQEGWCGVIDGEPERSKYFKTKEDAMFAYSLSANDAAGYYDAELFANIKDTLNLDWSQYAVNYENIPTIADFIKNVTGDEQKQQGKKYQQAFQVVVECKDEIEQQEIYQKLVSLGYICKVLTL